MAVLVPVSPLMGKSFAADSSAKLIEFNKQYTGELKAGSLETEYKIVLPSSGKLTVKGQTKVDVILSLDDSEKRPLLIVEPIAEKEIKASGRDYSVSWDLAKGTYYLRYSRTASSKSSLSAGSFNLTASFESANETYTYDNNYVSDLSKRDAVPFNKKISGQLALNDKTDMFKVELPSSGRLRVSGQTYIDKQATLALLDPKGNQLYSTQIFKSDRDYSASWDLTKGTYYLKYHSGANTGNFSFTAKFTSAKETYTYENNYVSDLSKRAAIPFNKKINGQLALTDDTDMYKVKLPAGGTLKVSGQTYVDQIVSLYLLDSKGKQINKATHFFIEDRNFSKTWDLKKGTYYIKFNSTYNTGNFNFKITLTTAAPKKVKLTAYKKAIKVSAAKSGKVTGYQIKYKLKSSGKWKTVNVKTTKNLSRKIKGLKSKKPYYVKIRSYCKYNSGTFYSKWTAKKTVKAK